MRSKTHADKQSQQVFLADASGSTSRDAMLIRRYMLVSKKT